MAIQSLKTSEIRKKFQPFAPVLDILGSHMDEQGIHAQSDKMEKIRNWQEPVDHTGVLRFLGLIKYLSIFMLNVGSYTGPLQTICANKQQFRWTQPLHQKTSPMKRGPNSKFGSSQMHALQAWVL